MAAKTTNSSAVTSQTDVLPIRRVILYSNGVAYIERRGLVSGNAEVNLSFKQSQVDDVLKSMLVLDLGRGKIGAVSYNSSAPVSARMSEIPFSVNPVTAEGGGIAGVLSQLQGAKVAVASAKGVVIGSVLTVERKTIRGEKETSTTNVLVIASESGEISSFDLSEVRSVKLLDEGTRKDLNEFANATASARRLDAKTITVTSEGSGQREMIVSYTIAAPIWKTTYRVVLDEAGKPFFQGWAIVDNVSEEDWEGVQMSLVSGSPISFIQNLQKPFYRYRPIVPTPSDLQLQPQIYEPGGGSMASSISGVVVDANGAVVSNASITLRNNSTGAQFSVNTDDAGNFVQSGLPGGTYTITISSPGFQQMNIRDARVGANLRIPLEIGNVSSTVDVTASSIENLPANGRNFSQLLSSGTGSGSGSNNYNLDGFETTMSQALTGGNSGVVAAASGEEIGDLFEYRIERPVTVMRNRSALIPIVQTKMDGERVAVYNESVRQDRPFSGVLLKNTTDLTLESGSMTVIDGNAYAGEALMERLKAKEQRLISFALDLGTLVRVRENDDREPAKLIKVVNGVFQAHYFRTEQKMYQVSNQSERPKVLYIEYPIRSGWTISEDSPKPDYSTQRFHRFRIELKPFAETELKITERQPLMDTYQLAALTKNDLALFVSRNYIDDATRARLEKLIDLRARMGQIDIKLGTLRNEEQQISNDQKRLRENIEALAKTPEAKTLIARYIAKANEQETRLEEMDKERKTIIAEKEKLEVELALEIRMFEIK
jgi:hypothetical protein